MRRFGVGTDKAAGNDGRNGMSSGPAGDFDYERRGKGYAQRRRTDPRIAAMVHAALGDARAVVNVGAGAGSYEPMDREVTPVEPSAAMRAQRPAHLCPAVDATAEALPFPDDCFDAAMATVTIHQWPDLWRGLRELRRVSRGPVVILTFDPGAVAEFWLADYVPSLMEAASHRDPPIDEVRTALGGATRITPVPIPLDCIDGFIEAYYGRPERLLEPQVRAAQSAWAFADPCEVETGLARLRVNLDSGTWDERFGGLRRQPEYVGSLRLVVSLPA
jgi:SAM-dependent methyltransferase